MKFLHLLPLVLLSSFFAAFAELPTTAMKTPVGVPSDAKLFNGKWYRVYLEPVSWNTAKGKCASLGGQLVVIPDESTWTFVRQLTPDLKLWLGANDKQTQGDWKWVDGTPFTFKAWLPGQPDSSGKGGEKYLHIHGRPGKPGWNDAKNDGNINRRQHVVGFICEWKAR